MPSKTALEIMKPVALKLAPGDYGLRRPIHVTTGEGVDTARFVVNRYNATRDPKTREVSLPGLEMLGDRMPATVGTELLTLVEATQSSHWEYVKLVGPTAVDPMERARFLLGELKAVLEFHFDDGVEDDNDARLAAIGRAHDADPDSADAMALELNDYAALASLHRDSLDGVGGFKATAIDEAVETVKALRDKPAVASGGTPAQRDALELRNRLAWMLERKIGEVRSAARFVFRHHPEIIREVTSVYERRRRAALRREKAKKEGMLPKGPVTDE